MARRSPSPETKAKNAASNRARYEPPDYGPNPTTVDAQGVTISELRQKVWRQLTPAVAHDVGITLSETEKFLAREYTPPREVLHTLARRLGMT